MLYYYGKPSVAKVYRSIVVATLLTLLMSLCIAGYLYIEGRLLPDRESWILMAFIFLVMGFVFASGLLIIGLLMRWLLATKVPQGGLYSSAFLYRLSVIVFAITGYGGYIITTGKLPVWWVPL